MGSCYYICNTFKFYEYDYQTTDQVQLQDAEGFTLYEGEPSTSIKAQSQTHYKGFKSYACKHEIKEKILGKVFGKEFHHFLKPYEFTTLYNSNLDLLLIKLNTDASEDFVKLLNSTSLYKLESIEVDFSKIIPRVNEVSGLWISDINSMNLSSAGYYGNDVHKNSDVQSMLENGKISYIQIRHCPNPNEDEHTIGISKRGSLTLYNSYENEKAELSTVMDIYEKLLNFSSS